jgi:integrase
MSLPDTVTGRCGRPEWSPTFPTKAAADAHQRDTRKAIADRTYTRDQGLTLAEYLPMWLARKERAARKASTLSGYRAVIFNHLIPMLGKHRLRDLRPDQVQGMLDRIASGPSLRKGGERRPVVAGTLANIRAVLRAALNDALKQELVMRNVATLVTLPPIRRAQPKVIPAKDLSRFTARVETDDLAALWLLDAVYGMRRAELLGLRWSDIEGLDTAVTGKNLTGTIWIRQTLVDVAGDHVCPYCSATHRRLLFDTPKSRSGERCFPLVLPVVEALIAHRTRQETERRMFGADYADHGLVFATIEGNPVRPDWIGRQFKRLLRASGTTDGFSLKSLRSTMVTRLHERGVPLEVIGSVTGHSPGSSVTRDHYLSVDADRTRPHFAALAAKLTSRRSDHQSDHHPRSAEPSLIEATK